ncbi:questin oxidase family protein [Paraburkholderia sp. J94]|uniref:questin oxidase family protein n=1 Tax=Paraburkholderia sp. J94 TaxID=2805441 RepID=UPI002AB07D4E|nr:questin oxidase family protein [Paraburkholderia sp. J94]
MNFNNAISLPDSIGVEMRDDPLHVKLNELLDANARFDLAAKGTTNHCPMALVALAEMGASPARLQAFFEMWALKYALNAPPVVTRISRREWQTHVGERAAFGALRLCFLDWIADAGAAAVIKTVFSEVAFAPATQAFHAIIRLAYGVEAGHAGEIAAGLASLISSHLPIEIRPDERRREAEAVESFDHIAKAFGGVAFTQDSITARIRAVAADPRFDIAVLAPPTRANLLDDLARATINAYWHRPDFTILHTVTVTRAVRVIFALLDDALVSQLMPALWFALCAAYATVGEHTGTHADIVDRGIEWPDVCRLAIASDDDHVIKMTYTCLCEHRRDPSPLYLASAARLVS